MWSEDFFKQAPEASVILDLTGRIYRANDEFCKLLGLDENQCIGKKIRDFLAEEKSTETDSSWIAQILQKRTFDLPLKNSTNQTLELRWLIKESQSHDFIFLTNHPFDSVYKEESERLQRILDGIPSMIGYWDTELKNRFANKVYSSYFGKIPEQIRGLHIRDVLGEKLFQANYPYMLKALHGDLQTFEREIPLVGGGSRHTLAKYIPDYNHAGTVVGFFVIVVDVSELKKAQSQLMETSKMAALGVMAAGLAHEINNPLAIIRGKVDLLKRKVKNNFDPMSIQTELEKIDKTSDRISSIVKGLKAFARSGEEDPFLRTSVKSIVEETITLCRDRFQQKNVSLKVEIEDDLQIECREGQIMQVLINLLNNSLDAIQELPEKWILIEAHRFGQNQIRFAVTDSGAGVPKELVDEIMSPFFTTKEVGQGTGLGLSISQSIVQKHGGRLFLDKESRSTRFIFELPSIQTDIRGH